jgi:hypothetical protein
LVWNNEQLTSLAGMGRLARVHDTESVFAGFDILDNAALTSIGLRALVEIDASVRISDNPVLPSLAGLEELRTITGSLRVEHNETLVSLNGLEQLTSVGEAIIDSCPELKDLHALASLTTVESTVSISRSEKLPTCEAEWLGRRLESLGVPFFAYDTDDGATCP